MTRCAFVLACLGLLGGCASRPAPSTVPREGYVLNADSVRLFYRVEGSGRDTLLALHGGPGSDLESIAGDFAPLSARHTVIFYDQRGAGRSTLPADTAKLGARQQVEDLEAVRRHFGLDRFALVAHSYGPLLAASYALAYPERVSRMVFFGPVPPLRGDALRRMGATIAERLDTASRARMADAVQRILAPGADTAQVREACRQFWAIGLRPRLAEPERSLSRMRSDPCASDPNGIRFGFAFTNRVVMRSHADWDLRTALAGVQIPTLIVYGEAEAIPIETIEEWGRVLPRAALLRVSGAAHYPHAERPEFVWPAVERFLAGKLPRPR